MRRILSAAWALGLFVLFALALPYLAWLTADALGAGWLIALPIVGCVYLIYAMDNLDLGKWHPVLAKIEDPFTRTPDVKAGLLLFLMPMLAAAMMINFLALSVFEVIGG